ncbi:MAG: class II glutamine amidotransferase [Acidimicrobiia bacterium]
MCRHLAYIGDARPIGELLFDAPHALRAQGEAPLEMVVAKDNPDGWGVAWWDPDAREPHHYRTTTRMWDDEAFRHADHTATAALGAVRKASPNTDLDPVNNAPFVAGTCAGAVAFSLNGHALHASCAARVRAAVDPAALLVGNTDSEMLFSMVRSLIADGVEPPAAVAAVHRVVDPGPEVYVNLLLVMTNLVVATTWQHTLYVDRGTGGTTVSSEPLDTRPDWTRVPDASLLVASPTELTITPLEGLR